jgi:hypothetical protein
MGLLFEAASLVHLHTSAGLYCSLRVFDAQTQFVKPLVQFHSFSTVYSFYFHLGYLNPFAFSLQILK